MNLGELDLTSEDFWLDEVDGTVLISFDSFLKWLDSSINYIDIFNWCCLVSARYRLGAPHIILFL